MNMNLTIVNVEKPEETNFILGQSHFIKTATPGQWNRFPATAHWYFG